MSIAKRDRNADNPKDTMIRVRVNKETLAQLEYVATIKQISKSDVIRNGIKREFEAVKK